MLRQEIYILLLFISVTSACIRPEKGTLFADFARRSDVVLRAEVVRLNPVNNGAKGRYDATFRIIGLFSAKSQQFAIGDTIRLGQFGRKPLCAPVQPKSQHILFLRKLRDGEGGIKASYGLRYNPVPLSNRNTFFFGRFLAGKILRTNILSSGCRGLKRPQHGKIQCTTTLDRCRIMCNKGYKLTRSSKYKNCDILTGIWRPNGRPKCEAIDLKPSKKSGVTVSVIRNIIKSAWSPKKRIQLPVGSSRDEEVEEEEEVIEEEMQPIRKARKPWKPSTKYVPSSSKIQEEEEEEEEEQEEEEEEGENNRIQISQAKPSWSKKLISNVVKTLTKNEKEEIKPTTIANEEENLVNSRSALVGQPPISLKSTPIKITSLVQKDPSEEAEDSTTEDPNLIQDEHLVTLLNLETLHERENSSIINQTTPIPTTSAVTSKPRQLYQSSYRSIGLNGDSWLTDGVLNRPVMLISGAIFGCPTYKGTVTIHSSWHNGFTGDIYFPAMKNPIMGGWMTRIAFNMEVEELETYTVDFLAVTHNRFEYCFMSKTYNLNIYYDQDLTLSFVGKIRESIGNTYPQIKGTAELLGYCADYELRERKVGTLVPSGYIGSLDANIWDTVPPQAQSRKFDEDLTNEDNLLEDNYEENKFLFAERCLAKTRNGGFPAGGKMNLKWKKTKFQGNQLKKVTANKDRDYNEIIHKSILFYEAQRSGILSGKNRVLWRSNSDVKDGCRMGVDLTGGWYCGSGNVKNTFLIAYSTTMLIWGAIDYNEAYKESGEIENLNAQIRWATDYLIKCHLDKNELVVQIGNYLSAAKDWNRPEDSKDYLRKIYKVTELRPGSDVAGEAAAALAAASIYFQESDPEYSQKCLKHAEELFKFADNFRGSYSSIIPRTATRYFTWHGINDELAWGALWLYRATDNPDYLQKSEDLYQTLDTSKNIFQWDDKTRGLSVLLAKVTRKPGHMELVNYYVNWLIDSSLETVNGLVWINQWGPTMHAANAAFLALQAMDLTTDKEIRENFYNFSKNQMEILVGGIGDGFVVGMGPKSPQNPHHRGSTCPLSPEPCDRGVLYNNEVNPNILFGALVAGPDKYGRYTDTASDYVNNEVSIGFNAGFQSLAVGLKQKQINKYRT